MAQELEVIWSKMLERVEKYARTTIMSGAAFNDEDVGSPRFICQCKDIDRKNIIIDHKDWRQLQIAALKSRTPDGRSYKIGLFINRNSSGDIVVSMDAQDFLSLVENSNVEV